MLVKSKFSRWAVAIAVVVSATRAFALTTDEVMEKAVNNIRGPAGKMVLAEGRMQFSRRNLHIRTARYYRNGTEGFQIDVLSPVEDQEVPGAGPQTNKKYRVVRNAMDIATLTYLPSLRRGRKISYVPLDGILGSDYPYYLLPIANALLHDFSYTYVKEHTDTPIIKGVKKEGTRSPYSQVEIQLRKMGNTYAIEQAIYQDPHNQGFTLLLQDYQEFTPGYWAPRTVTVKKTTFTFEKWTAQAPRRWLHSTNHGLLDTQTIPKLDNRGE